MTPPQQPRTTGPMYLCNEDDLGCIHDLLMAAMVGDDLSAVPRLWNAEISAIRSRPAPIKENCPYQQCEFCPIAKQIREQAAKAERERVLTPIEEWASAMICIHKKRITLQNGWRQAMSQLKEKIEFLRPTPAPEPQEGGR